MFKKYIILIILILIISGCEKSADKTPDDSKTSDLTQESYLKGITLTPKSFQGSDFTDFFKKAQELGNIVSWAGDWNELSNTKNGGPTVVASLASQYDYIPIIEAQFFTQSTGKLVRNLDDITKQSYKTSAINFAEKFKPKYLGFGIEIKIYVNKPIAFTEIGWHTSQSPVGWESSESEQAEFIKTFFELTKDINKEFVVYSFMFDQNTIEPFHTMGLYNNDGSPKLALDYWSKI